MNGISGWFSAWSATRGLRKALRPEVLSSILAGKVITLDQIASKAANVSADRLTGAFEAAVSAGFLELANGMLRAGNVDDKALTALEKLASKYGYCIPNSISARLIEARDLAIVETHPLSSVSCPYNLKRGEVCYATVEAEALETRTRTVRTHTRGSSVSFRVARGVSYRIGSYKSSPVRQEYNHSFGYGTLSITNKRVIMSCPNKNITVMLDNLIAVDYFNDGLTLHKGSGKPILLSFHRNPSIAVVLSRCIDGSQADHIVESIPTVSLDPLQKPWLSRTFGP